MKQKIIIFALLSLAVPLRATAAYGPQGALPNVHTLDNKLDQSFAYIDEDARESMMELLKLLPHHAWSSGFKNLCQDFANDGNVAYHEQVESIVSECLAVLKRQHNNQFRHIKTCLKEYKETLDSGKAQIQFSDIASEPITRSSSKTFCKLAASCLNVTGHLFVNGVDFSNVTALAGAVGATGLTGATGATGTGAIAGYAEFTQLIQAPNNSVPPGQAFSFDTQVYNSIPATIVASPGAGGTVFTLGAGTYLLNYEMSLTSAGSIAVYTGATAGSLVIDNNTITGSATGTTWYNGRAIEVVPVGGLVVAISSVVGTAAVTTAGTAAGDFVVRLTILKIA